MTLTFEAVREDLPGIRWQAAFRSYWPGWKAWYLAGRREDAPSLQDSKRALARYMPEFLPTWHRLVALAENVQDAAQFLTFWCPPPYLAGCSQAVLVDEEGPVLVRNYDLDPALNEPIILNSSWNGRRVIGSMEAIAGLADGINDRGLAVSLTFGGRQLVGVGFGIPLILRYILETCDNTEEAIAALRRIPCHQAYNVTLLDKTCAHATVLLVPPEEPTIVTRELAITNHQVRVDWHDRARLSRTVERKRFLDELLANPKLTSSELEQAFLAPPLFTGDYQRGFGTVYTASYRPREGSMTLLWPDQAPWRQSFREFSEERRNVQYGRFAPKAASQAWRSWQDWLAEGPSVEQRSYLPVGFYEALLRGIKSNSADDWIPFIKLWTTSQLSDRPASAATRMSSQTSP
jgi:predicted choloylglycine hydrolase